MVWVADFLSILFGHPLINMTAYMFDERKPWFLRALSFFHFWLPFFLLGLVWRLGYDRRAFALWTVLAWADLSVCYVLIPGPPAPANNPNVPVNINYVYGLNDTAPQTALADPDVYFALEMLVLVLGIMLPSHLACVYLFQPAKSKWFGQALECGDSSPLCGASQSGGELPLSQAASR